VYDHELHDDAADDEEEFYETDDGYDVLPKESWYHGRLERRIAEERLACMRPGSYLIRISERKTGNYVLSFSSYQNGLTHFRVISICGDFYIGGRQFESLEELVYYYSYKACLLEDEVLKYPVAPPEPVDDRRRVTAVLPYTKVPDADNDELSFERDDIFIVHEDLSDDWMWCTSLRTNEQGIVFKGLVKEVDENADIHVGKEWFHNSITRDEAHNLLTAVRVEGSFLVRKSDSTPGDYVLYFYNDEQIQRFKINTLHQHSYIMGGRSYESIDEIVARYRNEQIVAGKYLTTAVVKTTDVSAQRQVDIYQTVVNQAQTSVSSAAILNQQGVVKKGHLLKKGMGKRGKDTKKWKSLYFALNENKQHLYFFEHEKKTRPKGMIDLSYGAVYPVHESYFGRPNCFQVVIRALREETCWFFCADTTEIAHDWMKILRANCAKPNRQPLPKANSARQVRNLQVTVQEASKLPSSSKHLSSFCTVMLNQVHVGRTKLEHGSRPLWGQLFIFDDVPPDVDSITISIHNANMKKKNSTIGHVTIHFSKLSSNKSIDEWYTITPTANNSLSGSLRIRTRYCNQLIMPVHEYEIMKQLVTEDMRIIEHLSDICGQDRTPLAACLLKIFRHESKEMELMMMLNSREIEDTMIDDAGTLFRRTSLASTVMEQYMRSTCSTFVSLALGESVKHVVDQLQSCELNPAKCDVNVTNKQLEGNLHRLLEHLTFTLRSIINTCDIFPKHLIRIFAHLQRCVAAKWPNDMQIPTRVVSGFLFLRLLCPAIISPKSFNLVSDPPSPMAARTLLLVAKSLQNLANLVEFGGKEGFMSVLNQFILENKPIIINLIKSLADENIQVPLNRQSVLLKNADISRDLAAFYQLCKEHQEQLQVISIERTYMKKLLGVLQLLDSKIYKYQMELRLECL